MKTNTHRLVRYAGTGLVTVAATCALSAPAFAMLEPGPQPPPVHGQSFQSAGSDEVSGSARIRDAVESGVDWSTLATGGAAGAALTGAVILAGIETRRHRRQPHPA